MIINYKQLFCFGKLIAIVRVKTLIIKCFNYDNCYYYHNDYWLSDSQFFCSQDHDISGSKMHSSNRLLSCV